MEKRLQLAQSVVIGAIVSIVFVSVVTVVADLVPPLKDWLKTTFTHHWIGKGALSVGLFIVTAFVLARVPMRATEKSLAKVLWMLFWAGLAGTLVIFAFYLWEAFFA